MSENQINLICSSFSFKLLGLKVKSWKNKHVSWKLLALGIAGISCLFMTCRLVSEPADFSYAAVNIFYGCQYRQPLLCHLQTWAWFKLLDMLKINYLFVRCFCRFGFFLWSLFWVIAALEMNGTDNGIGEQTRKSMTNLNFCFT